MGQPRPPGRMPARRLRRHGAAMAAVAALPVAATGLAAATVDLAGRIASGAWTVSDAIALAVVSIAAAAAGYLAVASLAAIAGRGRRAAMAALPAWWRPVVAAALGTSVAFGAVLPAHAVEADFSPGWIPAEPAPQSTDHLGATSGDSVRATILDQSAPVSDSDETASTETQSSQSPGAEHYSVVAGDSLWSITARLLGHPGDHVVAEAWPELYSANASVIGDDPGLILPGQRLTIPEEWST